MNLLNRWKGSFLGTVLSLALVGCATTSAESDRPLIFSLKTQTGRGGCLVAINHLVLHPAEESAEIVACERQARSLVMEAAPKGDNIFSWSRYARRKNDPSSHDLSQATTKKVRHALALALYSQHDIEFLLTLHPAAIYRALTYSKALSDVKLVANLDLRLMQSARLKNFAIREMEGMEGYFENERRLTSQQLEEILPGLCDLFIEPERLKSTRTLFDQYANNSSAQPDIDTARNKKLWFNTIALGLPEFTVAHDVDARNPAIVRGMLKAIEADGNVLIFVGAAHIGGPEGVIKLLQNEGVTVSRLR